MPAGGKFGNRGNRVGPHHHGIPPADSDKRCQATCVSSGLRCATWAVRGSAYCKTHVKRIGEKEVIKPPTDPLTAARKKRGFRFSDMCVNPVRKAALQKIEEENEDPNQRLSLFATETIVNEQLREAFAVHQATFEGKLDKKDDENWNREIRETATIKLKEAIRFQKEIADASTRIEVMRKEVFKEDVEGISKVAILQIMGVLEKHLGPQRKNALLTEVYAGVVADLSQINSLGSCAPKVTITI